MRRSVVLLVVGVLIGVISGAAQGQLFGEGWDGNEACIDLSIRYRVCGTCPFCWPCADIKYWVPKWEVEAGRSHDGDGRPSRGRRRAALLPGQGEADDQGLFPAAVQRRPLVRRRLLPPDARRHRGPLLRLPERRGLAAAQQPHDEPPHDALVRRPDAHRAAHRDLGAGAAAGGARHPHVARWPPRGWRRCAVSTSPATPTTCGRWRGCTA